MLRVNQLSGFGGTAAPALLVATGATTNTSSPSFSVDLGPPGVKQVICAFAATDTNGGLPWTWTTGSVGGEAFTYVVGSGEETAGNGSTYTGGATIRALQTSLSGVQTVSIGISGIGVMDATAMLALVVRGFSTTPIAYDGGANQGVSEGNDFTISTVGARLVIGATAAASAPGSFQGPGSEVTAYATGDFSLGYDLSPAGGAADVYSFSGGKYVIAGASFG
jgi:hypothetical protein